MEFEMGGMAILTCGIENFAWRADFICLPGWT